VEQNGLCSTLRSTLLNPAKVEQITMGVFAASALSRRLFLSPSH
jgi:hypothetical protein